MTVDVMAQDLGNTMAHDMSAIGMFIDADLVVKAVMLLLLGWSFWSWAIIIHKRNLLNHLNRRAVRFEDSFWSGEPLDKIYARVKKSKEDPMLLTFLAGMDEWKAGIVGGVPSSKTLQTSLKQRVERAMNVAIGREVDQLERGMIFLASVASSAPFVGLFGTVWGIMNSFSEIASTNNTSLAVVAPGIAQALFTTALGLVAAIPASIAFNVLSSSLNRYASKLETFADEFLAILSRHLDSHEMQVSNNRKT
ncbi:MAG: protein TolQ [Alphaproteobacteria bacterium]